MRTRDWTVSGMITIGVMAAPVLGQPGTSPAPAPKPSAAKPSPVGKVEASGGPSKELVAKVLAKVAVDGETSAAFAELHARRDLLIAYGDLTKMSGEFRELARGLRLVDLLRAGDAESRARRAKFLIDHPKFASELAFVLRPDRDKHAEVLNVLDKLAAAHPTKVDEFAGLAAACCVVFDEPVEDQLNENQVKAAPVEDVFGFLVRTAPAMVLDPRQLPVELLVYVVDATSPISELAFVENRFRKDTALGRRYFDVVYDNDHFKKGTPKKVTVAGYSLPNIIKHGGVCIDQAYFAEQIGKTLGMPTVIVTGKGADVAHAWLGYVERKGGGLTWDMSNGRYPGYTNVIGYIDDPQAHLAVKEGELNVLASFASESLDDRRIAIGLVDAVQRLREVSVLPGVYPPSPTEEVGKLEPRKAEAATRLQLLDAAARRCSGLASIWREVTYMSANGELDPANRKKWAEALVELCAKKYPDFACENLMPLISSVQDTAQQDKLWDWAFKKFIQKPPLASRIRFANAEMWDKADHPDEAWKCYAEVISRFVNDGAEAVTAADQALLLLQRHDRPLTGAIDLIGDAWKKCKRPQAMGEQFAQQSTWYQLGRRYAGLLAQAGKREEAQGILRQIGGVGN
jgi:hypothetical protein